ncbi:hypothetical protein [Clostridium sp. BJN0001]|uniref:RNA polymerase factor sigma-54 n=1 Tax=Clostridium sp. BJN0001 TaxID=2930219 RepID=UPI001FCFAD2C|nr:hypothetical protein [Clostridium sp. BJN0001]
MELESQIELDKIEKRNFSAKIKQSIKILKMSMYDLKVYVNLEYINNPALEIYEKENVSAKEKEINIKPYLFLEQHRSLKKFLIDQLRELNLDKRYLKSCKYIVKLLNGNGYLDVKLTDINMEIGIPLDILKKSLDIIQSLKPYGIGARNLKECLLIQMKKLGVNNDKIKKIVKYHLSDVGSGRFDLIAKDLSIKSSEVKKYVEFIKTLEPKPSRGFYTCKEASFIIPDAEMKFVNGKINIVMNDDSVPSLSINKSYEKVLKTRKKNFNKKYYEVEDEINMAYDIIRDIKNRRRILYNILKYIGNSQEEYFMYGKDKIKKISIDKLSLEIRIDKFIIKNAIKNKSIVTKYGIIKLEKIIDI